MAPRTAVAHSPFAQVGLRSHQCNTVRERPAEDCPGRRWRSPKTGTKGTGEGGPAAPRVRISRARTNSSAKQGGGSRATNCAQEPARVPPLQARAPSSPSPLARVPRRHRRSPKTRIELPTCGTSTASLKSDPGFRGGFVCGGQTRGCLRGTCVADEAPRAGLREGPSGLVSSNSDLHVLLYFWSSLARRRVDEASRRGH